MPGTHRIRCVQRGEGNRPHERITHIGGSTSDGTRWKISQTEAMAGMRDGVWTFYVSLDGETLRVDIAKGEKGEEYLKTEKDGTQPEQLLSLPEWRAEEGGPISGVQDSR